MSEKYVVIIQCEIAHNRCSGYACTEAFYERQGKFVDYDEDVRYISFTCGGCCGKGTSAKMEHLGKRFKKSNIINKDDVSIHLASCMVTDNYHYDRCPHIDYIKSIILKKGFKNINEGSYISKAASNKREKGIYNNY